MNGYPPKTTCTNLGHPVSDLLFTDRVVTTPAKVITYADRICTVCGLVQGTTRTVTAVA